MSWSEVLLGDVIDVFDSKRVPLSSRERAERQGAYPYYGAQGVIDHVDDYLFEGRYILIPEDGENLNSRKLPIAYFADGRFWVNNHAHVARARPGVAVDRFIQSALQATDISPFITGAAQPKLSQANLRRIPLRLPPLEDQRRIAQVLDAMDDLIENIRRRVAVLDEMAQAIYREWFVDFRYPGHEGTKLIASPLGLLPPGWETCRLLDLALINARRRDASQMDWFQYLDISSLGVRTVGSLTRLPGLEAPGRARRGLAEGDVVWATVRPGRRAHALLLRVPNNLVGSTALAVITPQGVPSSYLFEALSTPSFTDYLTSKEQGAAYPAVVARDFEAAPMLLPPEGLLQEFDRVVAPSHHLAAGLREQAGVLVALRDLLLPKLVSGEIDVSSLKVNELVRESAM